MLAELTITFDTVREANEDQLKALNSAMFPIKYQVRIQMTQHSTLGKNRAGTAGMSRLL